MADVSLADALYGAPPPPGDTSPPTALKPSPDAALASALYGGDAVGKPDQQQPGGKPVDTQAKAIFGEANDGSVLENYGPVVSPVFEQEAFKARFDGNHDEALEIDKAAQGLNDVFKDFEVGENLAKGIMQETSDYLRNQRSEETIIQTEDDTMAVLREKYGADLEKNLAGARRVIREAGRQVPNLIQVLERTGLGNSLKVVENCIVTARKKGYVK